ncbi:MAG TPA: hypothetical protein VJU83_01580, partial [Burkholderiales bacterium]|nr:hypothetical protein [Burkholderiales bacterium]
MQIAHGSHIGQDCDAAEKTKNLFRVRLADLARISVADGPPMLRSENARLSGWVYVDIRGRDLRSAVREM